MNYKQIFVILGLSIIFLSLGCVDNETTKNVDISSTISDPVPTPTATATQISEQTQIEKRIDELESRIAMLEKRLDYNGVMPPSDKELIPSTIPFSITYIYGRNITYLFKENGVVEITKGNDAIPIMASYILFRKNNTIKVKYNESYIDKKRPTEFYREEILIRLLDDDHMAYISDTGWASDVSRYEIKTDVVSKWSENND